MEGVGAGGGGRRDGAEPVSEVIMCMDGRDGDGCGSEGLDVVVGLEVMEEELIEEEERVDDRGVGDKGFEIVGELGFLFVLDEELKLSRGKSS